VQIVDFTAETELKLFMLRVVILVGTENEARNVESVQVNLWLIHVKQTLR